MGCGRLISAYPPDVKRGKGVVEDTISAYSHDKKGEMMKIKNKKTNVIFDLPKIEVESLIQENPDIYEKLTRSSKKKKDKPIVQPEFEQDTILPLIWEK